MATSTASRTWLAHYDFSHLSCLSRLIHHGTGTAAGKVVDEVEDVAEIAADPVERVHS